MFAQTRTVAALITNNGLIAIDEHSSISCMIHDLTATGLSLTVMDSADVPNTFVLLAGSTARVCTIVRRCEEEIVASFADVDGLARASETVVKPHAVAQSFGRRRFAEAQSLRRAA